MKELDIVLRLRLSASLPIDDEAADEIEKLRLERTRNYEAWMKTLAALDAAETRECRLRHIVNRYAGHLDECERFHKVSQCVCGYDEALRNADTSSAGTPK